jgi:hypothetical protein
MQGCKPAEGDPRAAAMMKIKFQTGHHWTLTGSAGMNALAFAAQVVGAYMTAAAITLGVAIRALIYALTRVGAALYIDCHARA